MEERMSALVSRERINQTILVIRGHNVMLDSVLTHRQSRPSRLPVQCTIWTFKAIPRSFSLWSLPLLNTSR